MKIEIIGEKTLDKIQIFNDDLMNISEEYAEIFKQMEWKWAVGIGRFCIPGTLEIYEEIKTMLEELGDNKCVEMGRIILFEIHGSLFIALNPMTIYDNDDD